MIAAPPPHGQAALMPCESLACLPVERRLASAEQVGDAIRGIIKVKRETAGTSENVVVSVAWIPLLRTLAQSLAATPPFAAGAEA